MSLLEQFGRKICIVFENLVFENSIKIVVPKRIHREDFKNLSRNEIISNFMPHYIIFKFCH